jgi:hypothetical protein
MNTLHEIWLSGSQWLICIKQVLSYLFVKLSFKILVYKGQDNPHTLQTDQVCSSGQNSTKFEVQIPSPLKLHGPELLLIVASQVLKHSEKMMRFFRSFHG